MEEDMRLHRGWRGSSLLQRTILSLFQLFSSFMSSLKLFVYNCTFYVIHVIKYFILFYMLSILFSIYNLSTIYNSSATFQGQHGIECFL